MRKLRRRFWTRLLCFCLSFFLVSGQFSFHTLTAVATLPPAAHIAQSSPSSAAAAQAQGRIYYEAGNFAEAAESWEQAAQFLSDQGDTLNQASVLSNLSLVYQQMGEMGRSNEAIAQALTLLQTLTSTPNTADTFAQVWNTQGNLSLLSSQPAQALDAFQTATRYYAQANNNNGALRSQLNQAQALQALGFYRRAQILLTDLAPALDSQPDADLKATGLRLLGDLLRTTGDLEASQTALATSLATAQTLPSPEAAATTLLSLGHTAEARGNSALALDYYQESSAIATTPQTKLRAQLSQLDLLQVSERAAETANLYSEIQTHLSTLPVNRTTLNARLDLARHQIEDPSIAAQSIARSLAIARQQAQTLNDLRAESYALGTLGTLYVKQQQFSDAQIAFQQALQLAENLNAADIAYQWQWQLGRLYKQQNDSARALTAYENAAQNLESLRGNLIAIAPDLRFDFREKVEPVYREWVDLLLAKSTATDAQKQERRATAREAIESLQLAELENFFQEPCVALSQEIDQIIENTTSPSAVIYPIILADRLELILKLPQQPLQQYTVPVSQTQLETLLTQLQADLRLPYTLNAVKAESAQLYDWLIRPTETALADSQIDTLVFVLDGFLRSIPMATLYDGEQYLVEKFSIALAPGLQLVAPEPLERSALSAVIAGLSESRHGFSKLPYVQSEVEQVQQTTQSHVLFNETFTEANLAALLNNTSSSLIHLATHGQFSSQPEDTFILAWDRPIRVNEFNQILRQSEQSRQGTAVELLILSACETAAGDKRAALGLAGIAVQAGARSTLASLWNLDDETGALFSDYFYQELRNPDLSKAQALRNAQLRFLNKDSPLPYQHPRYWAPYVLLGNWL
ncbi:MAG: CHAT domain-containing protein [Phormidesmis sp.]